MVPEAAHLALRPAYESNLRGYRDGGPDGVHAWLLYAAEAYAAGGRGEPAASGRRSEGWVGVAGPPTTRRRHPKFLTSDATAYT